MRTLLIAAAAGLMTFSALPVAASASAPQERRYDQNQNPPAPGRPNESRPNDPRPGDRDNHRPGSNHNDNDRGDSRYGQWDNSWGARPSAPPRAYTSRQNDWYRHVRACSARYRSYNPRTDTYVVRRNVTARCRL